MFATATATATTTTTTTEAYELSEVCATANTRSNKSSEATLIV